MTFVTDTHPLVYHLLGRRNRIGRRALGVFDAVKRGRETIIVPFTVLEEIMLLSEIGRIRLPLPFRDFVVSVRQAENFDLGTNDTDLLLEAATFTTVRDPYDRLIIAQARIAGVPLITGDEQIQESGLVRTVWE
jgi:PIN domain nuclease of toxin-antitoxin system